MTDVSVVIPVYNAGANIIAAIESVHAQTLAADQVELVVVDDGSTDGTSELLDRLAAADDRIRVLHIPPSGFPGRPRNVGVREAHGRYVHFLDCDDTLAPEALHRLLALADEVDADVVAGKLSSDFRDVDHAPFRETRVLRLEPPYELTSLSLTPHKMFRRAFLLEHDISFDEHPRHAEDAIFCMHAYLHGAVVAVLADYPCYHYRRRRGFGTNLGDVLAVPNEYYRDIADIFELIDRHESDIDHRAGMYLRFCRTELLGRLRGQAMLNYDDEYRRAVFEEVRNLLRERVPTGISSLLPAFPRLQALTVQSQGVAEALEVARRLEGVRARPTVTATWTGHELHLELCAAVTDGEQPLRVRTGGDGAADCLVGLLPNGEDLPLAAGEIGAAEADVVVVNRDSGVTWFVGGSLTAHVGADGSVTIRGTAQVNAMTTAGGGPLEPGVWDVRLRYVLGGIRHTVALTAAEGAVDLPLRFLAPDCAVHPYWTDQRRTLALDVGEWMTAAHTLPGPSLSRAGATLTISAPAVTAAATLHVPAQLLVASQGSPAHMLDAMARLGPDGAAIDAMLPRFLRRPDIRVWWRLASAQGSAPAAELRPTPG